MVGRCASNAGAGTHINPFAWNTVASMLYLESPAGAGGSSGFSTCTAGGKIVDCCWDDKSQGVVSRPTSRTSCTVRVPD